MYNELQKDQPSKPTAWIILVAIVVVIIVGAYFVLTQEEETSINKINTVVNTNTAANENVNKVANTDVIDTSDWLTYENDMDNYKMKYPGNWSYKEIYLIEDPMDAFPTPIRYTVFYSPNKEFHLVLGLKKKGDTGSIYYRTGIGAGDIEVGQNALISQTNVSTWNLVYEGKIQEVFFYPVTTGPTYVEVSGYEVSVDFGPDEIDRTEFDNMMLLETSTYKQVLEMLHTIDFNY